MRPRMLCLTPILLVVTVHVASAFTPLELLGFKGERELVKIEPEKFAQEGIRASGSYFVVADMAQGPRLVFVLRKKWGDPKDISPVLLVSREQLRVTQIDDHQPPTLEVLAFGSTVRFLLRLPSSELLHFRTLVQ